MTTSKIAHFGLQRQYNNLKEELLDATHEVLSSGVLMNGTFTYKFTKWLTNRVGCSHAVVTHSGTQALEIMARYEKLAMLGMDESFELNQEYNLYRPTIRIPNLTYQATLNAFLTVGWDVSLIDTDENGLMLRNDKKRSDEYECLVGLYGAPPNINKLGSYVGPCVFVDGAQHWLSVRQNGIGLGMAISFDPTKNLPASGNGGAIVTDNIKLFNFALSYTNNGKPENHIQGTNSRMSELDCAHLLVRSRYIDKWQARRQSIRLYYIEHLKDLPIRCLSEGIENHSDQKFVIYYSYRNALAKYLDSKGIETRIHYPCALSELPLAKHIMIKPNSMMSTSILLSRGVLSLPIYPELTDAEVENIVLNIKKYFDK
jgi:dTDP-4-amino-4,6-dideoxygalactose transaminase